ncbi:hypothetical protein C8R44DRAFT_924871 [Mycena epipterygia]|nr:hypothetical protein C8R44DRAFT_924871 [Mycena epipterygia]
MPPREVKMLVRDWDTAIDFPTLRNSVDFQEEVHRRYAAYGADQHQGPGQIWHTPTELFKIGAGNGTLAMSILDHLRTTHPEVYVRTQYHIIEINERVKEPAPYFIVAMEAIVHNFGHDMIRYDLRTLEPLQTLVTGDINILYAPITDPSSPPSSRSARASPTPSLSPPRPSSFAPPPPSPPPVLPRLLRASSAPTPPSPSRPTSHLLPRPPPRPPPLRPPCPPPRPPLRPPRPPHPLPAPPPSPLGLFVPGASCRSASGGRPCHATLLIASGFFDTFFPTDFERLRDMYEHTLAQPHYFSSYHPSNRRWPVDGVASAMGERMSSVFTRAQFLHTYADLPQTRLRNGENPMVDFFENVKFLF